MSWEDFAPRYEQASVGNRARRAPDRDRARRRRPLRHRFARPAACRRRVRARARRCTATSSIMSRPTSRGAPTPRYSPDLAAFTAMLGIAEPLRRIAPRVTAALAARGHQHVVAQLLHVLRERSASGTAAAAARARRRRARALRRRRHGRPCRRRDRDLRGHELEPSRPDPGDGADRRSHRAAVGEPVDQRAAAPPPHARRHRRGRRGRRRMVGEHRTRRGHRRRRCSSSGRTAPAIPAATRSERSRTVRSPARFARPRFNAPAFRQNDAVARAILTTLASLSAGSPEAEAVIG